MPYTIEVSADGQGMDIRYRGTLTEAELIGSHKERYSLEAFRQARYIISDYTDVTKLEITTEGVTRVANLHLQAATTKSDVVLVMVAPSDLGFGLGRMAGAHMDEMTWSAKLVRTREEAVAFVAAELG